jgi:hypothetical protein
MADSNLALGPEKDGGTKDERFDIKPPYRL